MKIGLMLLMSEMMPSTMWPPLTAFWVFVAVWLPPQASRNSTPPARNAEKASAPPMPRRKSRRDHSARNRSNCLSESLLLTYASPPFALSSRLACGRRSPDYGSRGSERQSPELVGPSGLSGHEPPTQSNHLDVIYWLVRTNPGDDPGRGTARPFPPLAAQHACSRGAR